MKRELALLAQKEHEKEHPPSIFVMIFIDEYSKSKGPSSARKMILGLLNNIITGSDLDLNKFIENCDAKVSFKRISI